MRGTGWKTLGAGALPPASLYYMVSNKANSFLTHWCHPQNDWSFGSGTIVKEMAFQIHECLFWDSVSETTISQFLSIRGKTHFCMGHGNHLNILCSNNASIFCMPSLHLTYTHLCMHTWHNLSDSILKAYDTSVNNMKKLHMVT